MAATIKKVPVCEYCRIGLKGETELEEHLSKGDGHTFNCKVKHTMEMVRTAKSGERKFVCKVCGKGFKTFTALNVHSNVHTKQMTFVCDVDGCGKTYTMRGSLLQHKKFVHKGSSYECPKCGKKFGQKIQVKIHFKTVHEEKKDYKCVVCGAQFGKIGNLVRHTKIILEKIRVFKCEHCDLSFSEAGKRKRHIEKVHLKIRYPCTWPNCTHQASTTTYRKYHIRHAHTKDDSRENIQSTVAAKTKQASSGPAPPAAKKCSPSIFTPPDNQHCSVTRNSSKKGSIGSYHRERSSVKSTVDKTKKTPRISLNGKSDRFKKKLVDSGLGKRLLAAGVPASTVRVRCSEQVDEKSKDEIEMGSLKKFDLKKSEPKPKLLQNDEGLNKVDDLEDFVDQLKGHLESFKDQVDQPPMVILKDQLDEPPIKIVKEVCLFNDQLDEPSLGNVKEESLSKDQLGQHSMEIAKVECIFNDLLDPQPMVIVKEECLFNDQIDPSPMVIVKEECLDEEDINHNCTDISSSSSCERRK